MSLVVLLASITTPLTPKMFIPCLIFPEVILESIEEVTGFTVILE